ncbi:dihydroorotase [Nitrosomonas supralitoralis]|uniref:Dihydroorotase n=1 Tax=Nitrosomonas supralitoralis TaxID=2116706 RepID=A0A2P7NTK5_9PROT|nr:dihydroorotase [Nitrosomonas supralitoralis]PSJ16807.1 dihydroorotase [Nitrosomonas supralitoralis]
MTSITITRPDDWHLHLRDNEQLRSVLPHTAKQFARAIIMPNLRPPIVTTDMALTYRARIQAALSGTLHSGFKPLMTLYLTDNTLPSEIIRAKESEAVQGIKLYPAGATTNSDGGVTDITKCYAALETMEQINMPLLVHGEVTDANVDVFDKEKIFIDKILAPLIQRFPNLRIILEHITTSDAVTFVKEASKYIAATITAHHLLLNRNALFQGGIRPHHFCLPVLKREIHRQAVLNAAISGNPKFFLGTDSAPHAQGNKESNCGCAGIFTAHAAIELYATVFEQADALDKLEAFASFYGADFYQLPRNNSYITLKKEHWIVPEEFEFANEKLIPLFAGENLTWKIR